MPNRLIGIYNLVIVWFEFYPLSKNPKLVGLHTKVSLFMPKSLNPWIRIPLLKLKRNCQFLIPEENTKTRNKQTLEKHSTNLHYHLCGHPSNSHLSDFLKQSPREPFQYDLARGNWVSPCISHQVAKNSWHRLAVGPTNVDRNIIFQRAEAIKWWRREGDLLQTFTKCASAIDKWRSSRDCDLLLWRCIWVLWGDRKEPVVLLSNWIWPKLPEE